MLQLCHSRTLVNALVIPLENVLTMGMAVIEMKARLIKVSEFVSRLSARSAMLYLESAVAGAGLLWI